MNIKHRFLENVRNAPLDVKLIIKETPGGRSMIRAWDCAISRYHKDNDTNTAISYLQNQCATFANNQKNEIKTNSLVENLVDYIDDYTKQNFESVKTLSRLKVDIQHNNNITGEIFRIDKTQEGGYAITVMQREGKFWAHELRFPLLQRHYSNVYNCPFDLVKVGIYNYETKKHEYKSFDEGEIIMAWDNTLKLSNDINKFVKL